MFCHWFICDWQVLCEDSFSSDSDISEDEAKVDIQFSHILNLYWDIANGQGPYISRQVNIAQTLGSVTVSFTKLNIQTLLSVMEYLSTRHYHMIYCVYTGMS